MIQSVQNPANKLRIRFAYPWSKDASALDDLRYQFLRQAVISSGGKALKETKTEIARLRTTHAENVCSGIFNRIEHTDILLVDLTQRNPNVMLELGYFMALKRRANGGALEPKRFFLFCETSYAFQTIEQPPPPSDLAGLLITYYRNYAAPTAERPCYKILDQRGFSAKIQAILRLWKKDGGGTP